MDPDYRFFQEPDLPTFTVSSNRINKVRETLEPTPFERKKDFAVKYSIPISDVQTAFSYPWSIELFEGMTKTRDPKTVFNW